MDDFKNKIIKWILIDDLEKNFQIKNFIIKKSFKNPQLFETQRAISNASLL